MKPLLLLSMFLVIACNNIETDNIKSFIPGTYVKHIVNEYSKGNDTLIITKMDDNIYEIIRKSSFNRIRKGKIMPLEKKTETWTAIYDEQKKVMQEIHNGKIISFRERENELLVGSSAYRKI